MKVFIDSQPTFMQLQDIKIATYMYGSHNKENIFFIHGLGSSTQLNYPALQNLSAQYNLYTFDLPGHGHSQGFEDYSFTNLSTLCYSVLQHFQLKDFYLIGHSMGGLLSAQLSKILGCKGLVLSCTAGIKINKIKQLGLNIMKKSGTSIIKHKQAVISSILKDMKQIGQEEVLIIQQKLFDESYEEYMNTFLKIIKQFPLSNKENIFKEITVPYGIIICTKDKMVDNKSILQLLEKQAHVIKKLRKRHELTMQDPVLFAETVLEILQQLTM
ncbi:Alpha/beta hydrolase family protein [Spironucleus salmonicida]|uniref:Alpha/beta hydrolase n=1 Tax=Spironucleus salmonicida TaxID=348837 RepID=V6LM07_9EUKA|nr:Alpha/beta hydrolase family protein [Spironucleus salmonicida]|eukprot:EST45253.1 Alpha/beta hydrolase [Spironucleus salmonicida]